MKPARVEALRGLLSPDEMDRARRFRFARDQDTYVVARGVLRSILGRYLGVEPGQLEFSYGLYGKPALSGALGGTEIQFNLSHSGTFALYCLALGTSVGIDLEHISPVVESDELAARVLGKQEWMKLKDPAAGDHHSRFFRYWTRNEAYLKARGQGFGIASAPLETRLNAGRENRPIQEGAESQSTLDWCLWELPAPPGYAAALVVRGKGWRVWCWRWSEPGGPSAGLRSQG